MEIEEKWNNNLFTSSETKPLLKIAGNCERFGVLKLMNYVNIIDEEKELQFSSVIIEIDKDIVYVAFK